MSEIVVGLGMLSRKHGSLIIPMDRICGQLSCSRCGESIAPEGQCFSELRVEHVEETGNIQIILFLECRGCGYEGIDVALLGSEVVLPFLND